MHADLLDRSTRALPRLLDDLIALLGCETPSADLAAVADGAALVDRIGTRLLGVPAERLLVDGRTHLRWRLGQDAGPRVLLLCHQDTVWPVGTLARLPVSTDGGLVRGPGSFDMKTGLAMALHALPLVGTPAQVPVTVLVTGDEEVGSPTSRALIEQEAAAATATFVLEASADGGALKTSRKGVALYRVAVTGRAAHAGLEPERGVNAGIEIAHQVLTIAGLGDPALGTSVVPTALSAGTTTNTVPALGVVQVDSRAWTAAEQDRVQAAMTSLGAHHLDAGIDVTGGINRPPMEAAGSRTLFALAGELADRIGLTAATGPLREAAVGGASDGNFTAGVGCPTLDGLGAVGGGAHADHEHAVIDEIPGRTALLAALIDAVVTGAPVR